MTRAADRAWEYRRHPAPASRQGRPPAPHRQGVEPLSSEGGQGGASHEFVQAYVSTPIGRVSGEAALPVLRAIRVLELARLTRDVGADAAVEAQFRPDCEGPAPADRPFAAGGDQDSARERHMYRQQIERMC